MARGELVGWRAATESALYGAAGFYRRPEGPAGHFRTSAHASPLFAAALYRIARSAGLGTIVDVGAGRGELLRALHDLDPGLRLIGVEVADRPAALPAAIAWSDVIPRGLEALLVANEWLDNVPVDVVEAADDGPRLVLVDPATGAEELGGPPDGADAAWLADWWPLADVGERAEIGRPRDAAWAAAVGSLRMGLAVAIDYGHRRDCRPPYGSLAGYRDGRPVLPVPDGSCDITAHVALDACAAASGGARTLSTTQREALRALGVSGRRPPLELASSDPQAYLTALTAAGEEAELIARGGLGDFGWLVQAVGIPLPPPLYALAAAAP